ncbi:CdaR family protein [Namhaeicola litoreus]|uniref:CdaR family protein n=1 Tax=Namhaeicola litoreus TaxID=1052145 RepID=A0ABW3Y412_9FLAO
MFLLFLGLSLFFWFLINLSKSYITDVEFSVEFVDLPSKMQLQSKSDETLVLTVKSIGFNLLKHKYRNKKIQYSLKELKRKNKQSYYSVSSNNINFIQSQFSGETDVLKIRPDTLFFEFGVKKFKKISVNPKIEIQYKIGYGLSEELKFSPKEVTISGPEGVIDTINEVKVKPFVMDNVSESFEAEIMVVSPGPNVEIEPSKIKVKAQVEKFTEGSFDMSYKVINVPSKAIISTYPKELKLIFQVSLENYNKVLKEGFEIICDYEHSEKNNLDYLIPKVIKMPDFISSVRIVPEKVEFLIKSK